MIISRTPFRISFAGGGSDLPSYYRGARGAVVSSTIDQSMYVTVNERFDDTIRVSYTKTEIVSRPDDLQHEIVRACLRKLEIERKVEITTIADIPAGTGLGSSSTLTVGLLNALHAYAHRFAGAERLAKEACEIEIEALSKPIGKQDQYAAAYGGLNYIEFRPDESVLVEPIVCAPATRRRLDESLLLFYTGIRREADVILSEQRQRTEEGKTTERLAKLVGMADELRAALWGNRPRAMGEILHEAWMVKRKIASGITDPQIDAWYEEARAAGAVGGKLLGAGGGGFLLLYCEPEEQRRLRARMAEVGLREVEFALEGEGSRIIFVEE